MFSQAGFAGKCAIVTSYQPNASEIKGEETGEGLTEKLAKYNIYRKMLADYFEQPEDEAAKRSKSLKTGQAAFYQRAGPDAAAHCRG